MKKVEKNRNRVDEQLKFYRYIKGYKWQYSIMVLVYICVIVSQIAIPLMISEIITGFAAWTTAEFLQKCGILLLMTGLEALGTWGFNHYNVKLSSDLTIDAECDMINEMLCTRYDEISAQNSQLMAQTVNNDTNQIMDFYVEKIPLLTFQTIKGCIMLGLLFFVNTYMGLFALCGIAAYVLIYISSKKRYYKLSKKSSFDKMVFNAAMYGKIASILLVKLNAWHDVVIAELKKLGKISVKSSVKYLDFDCIVSNISVIFGRLFIIVMLLALNISGAKEGNAAGVLGSFTVGIFYVQELIAGIKYVLQIGTFYQTYRVCIDRMRKILEMPKDWNGEVVLEHVDKIELRQVSFGYKEHMVVENFSQTFEKGKIYAIAGENGSGKTSLCLMLLGVLAHSGGEVLWNGMPYERLNMQEMRKKAIGFVNQEPLLMANESVYSNLFFGREDCAVGKEVLVQYKLLDFIEEKEEGYDTKINSQSSNLSGGQKQRIAIMRALLKQPDILFFDEPTSALDAEGIQVFAEMLQELKKDKMILMVSHDTKMIEAADEVICLK